MVSDARHQPASDYALVQRIDGGPDLVHLHQGVRIFLSEIDSLVAAEVILVAVLLVSDAFRYGVPPVILRLQFVADRSCLRIEVDDRRPFASCSRPRGYRARLLDRLELSGKGTRTWVEIAVGRLRSDGARPE
jgi:hypothetical protein